MKKMKFSKKRAVQCVAVLIALCAWIFIARVILRAVGPFAVSLLKAAVCRPDSPNRGFCKRQCGAKDVTAQWCDEKTYDKNVPQEGMIIHVAEGGCRLQTMMCADSESCLESAWTCMAECPADPHREIVKEGCGCSGNWSPAKGRCVCREPFVERKGECLPAPIPECRYDKETWDGLLVCIAPISEVNIYWDKKIIYKCTGSCYSYLCVSNDKVAIGDYHYFRGKFKEDIPAERGSFKSLFMAMGGFYEACRTML